MTLEGKVVLITGASQGIGAACAAEFARAGARLSLTARNESALRLNSPPDALLTAGDLTDPAHRARLIAATLDRYNGIDILINNAGAGLYGPSWSAPEDEVRALLELNFFVPLALARLAIPHMRERHGGMIVNIGSIAGKMTLPWMNLYSASKYALGSWTEGLRMELRRDGIRTLIVCPGYVQTAFQKNVIAGQPPAGIKQARSLAITAAECARDIRRGVERNARTVVTPKTGWLLIAAMRLFPGFVESRMAKINGTA
ncbi:MAG TPA: SDR family NAD(P)-dependent oxidoreductase [Candidatus Limnocylindrales bacterium]|nr:SDR family NAD(P)-dependent oxidoreductase [Candidatus Limnocylindrales bacterium]